MELQEELQARIEEIDRILEANLPPAEGLLAPIAEAMRYSLLSGGKRIRPILMLEAWRLFGGRGKVIEPFLAAIEMIHAYSLVHDDLPAMDDDEYRRGRKSTHAAFGEAMGILAGDALLNRAFETAARAFDVDCSPRTARALQILAAKAGVLGMVGGQAVDVASEGREITPETLLFLHRCKTGALIEAAMMIGAVLAGAGDEDISRVERLAADVGLAFQIRDDVLDVTGSAALLGKPVGSDSRHEKPTYVSLFGLEKAREQTGRLSARALEALEALPGDKAFLRTLIGYMTRREK